MICGAQLPPPAPPARVTDEIKAGLWARKLELHRETPSGLRLFPTKKHKSRKLPMQLKTLLEPSAILSSDLFTDRSESRDGRRRPFLVRDIEPRANGASGLFGCGARAPLRPGEGPGCSSSSDPRLAGPIPLPDAPGAVPRCGEVRIAVPWAEGKIRRPQGLPSCPGPVGAAAELERRPPEAFRTSGLRLHGRAGVVRLRPAPPQPGRRRSDRVDEIQWRKGHDYVTLVYQIDAGSRRLLHVARHRTTESLSGFFDMLGREASSSIRYVCSDMWKPYLQVIAEKAPQALHVLDRFHIVANLQKAVNEIRAAEARKMKAEGYEDVLKHTKYCFLKNPENLTDNQRLKLKDVLQYDLKSVRAYLLKEAFQQFWSYRSPRWAEWYLKKWCARAARSRLPPITKFVATIRKHQPLIMNYFKAKKQLSSGVVEGLNRKVNLATRKAYGYRTFDALHTALFQTMGDLPEPESTHEFF